VLPSSNAPSGVHPEALAAWEEGNALLGQDPHTGSSEQGAPPTLLRAIERYEYAVAQAPSFARAWASLAEAYEYAFAYVGRDRASDAKRAEAAARRAVALDDKLAAAHANLALVLFYLRWDFARAEAEYRRTIELDGRFAYAVVEYADLLRETGRIDQAEFEVRKARAFLPALPVLASKQAEIELDRQGAETAIATARSALRLKRDYGRAHVVLGMAYERKGVFPQALEHYRAALAIDSQDRRALPALGYLLGRMGRRDEARAILQQLIEMNSRVRNCAFQVAVVYTGLGEYERALDWLEQAYKSHQMHVPFMTVEYRFEPLRHNERFCAILRQLGLRTSA
jgi:tetratricopeptide (TPR) repeat protein